jgi:glutamate N-acetyltransferase/amino-acid N-acetyltransferase
LTRRRWRVIENDVAISYRNCRMNQATSNLQIDSARLWDTIHETAKFGATPKGGVRRLTLGPEDKQVRDWFRNACEAAGLDVHVDTLGSMFALRKGRDMSKPPVGLGSHLDTQPTGGKFDGVLGTLAKSAAPDEWMAAAKAIMTTDTFAKVATATVRLGKAKVTINGMAKGAGMIAPDMATMLAFVFTDAPIAAGALQSLLKSGVEDTFNAVTIDGDTSTSDTLLAFATGKAAAHGAPKISRAGDPRLKAFAKAFRAVLADLAEQVARDGEGARKLVEIIVDGATSKASARKIAMSVANSPLVKTAIAGEDANWGRVVMAVGKAGEPANRDKLAISFNGIRVASRGARDPSYDEAEVSRAMKNPKIQIKIGLGLGKGRDRVLTCDLTKEYVAINGDYRS